MPTKKGQVGCGMANAAVYFPCPYREIRHPEYRMRLLPSRRTGDSWKAVAHPAPRRRG